MEQQTRVGFYTLGCKLNFSETSTIARQFQNAGDGKFQIVGFSEGADVYVINTCSVTENADKECRRIIRRALRQSPDAFIAVTGCYAQLKPKEIAEIPGVDAVLGAGEKFNLLRLIHGFEKKSKAEIFASEIQRTDFFVPSFSSGDPKGAGRTRSFLKVQDGCDYNCSFCTIPLARGESRSGTMEEILENAKTILQNGVKEIVLSGVNVGDYGKNHGYKFIDLIREMDEIGIPRIRISSIEPNLLTDEIISFVAESKSFMPHFHIPLQSGSNDILAKMRRRYRRELYAERVKKIKSLMSHACIGVDVIAGFPGETEKYFLDTYNFLNELDVSYLHVFPYSVRENTDASNLSEQVSEKEKNRRVQMLRLLSEKKRRYFYEQNLRKTFHVLFESETPSTRGKIFGFTENYIKVKSDYDLSLENEIVEVKLDAVDSDGIVMWEKVANENLVLSAELTIL